VSLGGSADTLGRVLCVLEPKVLRLLEEQSRRVPSVDT
jgi:hypothetical protein